MAETKKNTDNVASTVRIMLPVNETPGASQDEFYSVNFNNYIIKRGEAVEVPIEVAQLIENNEKSRLAAFKFVQENKLPDNLK